ncbi:MAG: 50S ribosomal protein L35 [Candidatus Absconditabacteria bacterium]|nr:50S ribosomal protein L35 [Candidatus Absconditabacteria bacterium]MDD3868544.1 50S ribosomal protein L35 [Candidatus Absconditabacteria bacterium]MDD4714108.1 50S ribosomal protein L35 [Candidatus Absconditabacteria bacterium]
MANKLKTHSGVKKRFKVTASGKVMSKKEGNNHLQTNKGKTNKKFSYGKELTGASAKVVKSLLN